MFMKLMKSFLCLAICSIMIFSLAACGSSADFKEGVKGTWNLYHYYENAESGVDVFLDDSNFWTVNVTDNKFTVTAKDGAKLEVSGGTFEWTKADEAEVVYDDGTHCTMRISENSKKHNELGAWDIYVVETNMYYVLEIPKGE